MNYKVLLVLLAGLVSSSANAATVFAPTDGDVNFLLGDLLGAQLAIFDDSDQSYVGLSLDVAIGDVVGFAGPNGVGNHIATNTTTTNTLLLTGSSNFILGLSTDGGTSWIADASVVALGANAYSVTFGTGANVIEVDVQIIPVPAAVWLFGSGLLGLVAVARRKAA
ncbi:MAG: VPLPA-CTERM sorting domain-containing protein [Gammaproteobacteria bacterium]